MGYFRRRNCATEDSTNAVGPVICIGDFDDGYDMPLPKVSKEKTSNEKMMEDAGNIMDVSYVFIVKIFFYINVL